MCLLSGQERETIDHLFLHCKFYSIEYVSSRCRGSWSMPKSLVGIIEAWNLVSFFLVWCYALEASSLYYFVIDFE